MFDRTIPTTIILDEWPVWIKDKFSLVRDITKRIMPILGEENKFFEDLNIDLNTNTYIPLIILHDNRTIGDPTKQCQLYDEEANISLSIVTEGERRINRIKNSNFILPPKMITHLTSLLTPNFITLQRQNS